MCLVFDATWTLVVLILGVVVQLRLSVLTDAHGQLVDGPILIVDELGMFVVKGWIEMDGWVLEPNDVNEVTGRAVDATLRGGTEVSPFTSPRPDGSLENDADFG